MKLFSNVNVNLNLSSTALCINEKTCSNHGTCGSDGKCICHANYFGPNCNGKWKCVLLIVVDWNKYVI